MPNDRPILVELFRHNLWANGVMLDACHDLSDGQLATELAGTYGRLDRTLVHLARAQGGYLRTLTDWQPGTDHRLEYDDPFPGVDSEFLPLGESCDRGLDIDPIVRGPARNSHLPNEREWSLPPPGTPGLIGRDREKPRRRRPTALVILITFAPGPHQRFLDHVLAIRVRGEPSGESAHLCQLRFNPRSEVRWRARAATTRVVHSHLSRLRDVYAS